MENIFEDKLISFETSKMIKKMGFPINQSDRYYNKDGNIGYSLLYIYRHEKNSSDISDIEKEYEEHFPCPTQTTVQRWLREIHKIYCESLSYVDEYGENIKYEANCRYSWYDGPEDESGLDENLFDTYEDALEDTFKDAGEAYLEYLIINKKETSSSKNYKISIG